MEITRDFTRCPRCGAPTQKTTAINKGESEFWWECTRCNTFINTYQPQEYQEDLHRDHHLYIGNFGGYGSGKTLTSREEVYKHMLITPKGNTLIGANVQSQYEATIKRDIESDLPLAFVSHVSVQKQYIQLINGHRIMFRPFDDVEKLRSYNLTMFVILEASEVTPQAFVQLKTRLRNLFASIPKRDASGKIIYRKAKNGVRIPEIRADWRKGIIESNPDSGWIKSEIVNKADDIQKHGNVMDVFTVLETERDPAISCHISTSDVNEFLPPNFKNEITKNKPVWWIAKFVYGSFMYAAGLVYPIAAQRVIPYFEIPKQWKRLVAHDYGLSDPSTFICVAIDEENNRAIAYRECYTNNKSVEALAKDFYATTEDIPAGGYYTMPIIDPKSGPKRDYNKKTLAEHYLDYNIVFQSGQVNVDARIFRLNTYLESKKLWIMDSCPNLIRELREYKFRSDDNNDSGFTDKPEDKNNHGINALEWIVMELPANPKNLINGVYNRLGQQINNEALIGNPEYHYDPLSDGDDEYHGETGFAFDIPSYVFGG